MRTCLNPKDSICRKGCAGNAPCDYALREELVEALLPAKGEIAAMLEIQLKKQRELGREEGRQEVRDHAEVIGNVTAALLDLDVTYMGNQATFTFLSTDNAMSYIHRARRIVEERLALIAEVGKPPARRRAPTD